MAGDTYDKFTLCFKEETSWGSNAIPNAGTTAYLLGLVSEKALLPDPEIDVYRHPPAAGSRNPSAIQKIRMPIQSSFYIAPVNGILYYLAWGTSSTVGAGPYTHTITRATSLPSITLHHEAVDSGESLSDYVRQFLGIQLAAISLEASVRKPYLHSNIAIIGKTAQRAAFKLTNAPDNPSGSGTAPYKWVDATRKYDGTAIDEVIGFKLVNMNNLFPILVHQSTGMEVCSSIVPGIGYYELELEIIATGYEFFDDALAASNTKTVELNFLRSATDYIKITCANCAVIEPKYPHPGRLEEGFRGFIKFEPETVSIEIKDMLAGSWYGE